MAFQKRDGVYAHRIDLSKIQEIREKIKTKEGMQEYLREVSARIVDVISDGAIVELEKDPSYTLPVNTKPVGVEDEK